MDSVTRSPSPQVVLCDVCGVEGFSEFLAVCTQCNKCAEHIYCVQAFCDSIPASWVCELCKVAQNRSQEEQTGAVFLNNECNRTIGTVHGTKLTDEQCMSEQGHGEGERSFFLKVTVENASSLIADASEEEQGGIQQLSSVNNRLKENSSVSSGTRGQGSILKQTNDNSSESICSQELGDSGKPAYGAKIGLGSKQSGSSVSHSKGTENLFSFLLPSPLKGIPRSKSIRNPIPLVVGVKKKSEQFTIGPTHFNPTSNTPLRKGVPAGVHAPIPAACLENRNGSLQKFEGILKQNSAIGLQGMHLNHTFGASLYCDPGLSVPDFFIPVGSERQLFHEPYQAKLSRQHDSVMQHSIGQLVSNKICAQKSTIIDSASPLVQVNPHVEKLWRGSFNVDKGDNILKMYDGFQAHPSSSADERVWKAARSLPRLLKVKELPRRQDDSTWPKPFSFKRPSRQSIDIFFFPTDMASHDSWYEPLIDRLIAHDLMLRAESTFLYLLIFHSQLFQEVEQLWDGRHYLWGKFMPKKGAGTLSATVVQSIHNGCDNSEVVDMEIDNDDVQPYLELYNGISAPPLPPGSPPAQPPPPSS